MSLRLINDIERINIFKLLGVHLSYFFSKESHIISIISVTSDYFLLSQLKNQGISVAVPHILFHA